MDTDAMLRRAALRRATAAAMWLALLLVAPVTAVAAPSTADRATAFPSVIDLPPGFQPEGIAVGTGTKFFTGSLVDGAIYRGSLRTGRGSMLVPGQEGASAFGLELDRRGRLFVAGGPGGGARVLDASTGEEVAAYQLTPAGTGLIHDVLLTPRAAFFTDSFQPVLYRVPIGPRGRLGAPSEVRTIPLSGDIVYRVEGAGCPAVPDLNVTGIEASPDGHRLILAQVNSGTLFSVDPRTGVAEAIDLGGTVLECANGLLRRDRRLYVAQPPSNRVAVVRLERTGAAAELAGALASPALDFPTAVGALGDWIYTPNARFATPQTPETPYSVARLRARTLAGQ